MQCAKNTATKALEETSIPMPKRIRSIYSGCKWIPKYNRDFVVQRYIYDKIFIKIQPVFPALSRNIEEHFQKIPRPGYRG